MARPILIGVGGSGQHALLAYLRLARLAGFVPGHLATVDADLRKSRVDPATGRSSGPPSTAQLLEEQLDTDFGGEVSLATLSPLPRQITSPTVQSFESLVQPAPGLENDLFRGLYNQRQRNVRVVNGFHGHPQVAATAFRMLLAEEPSRDDPGDLLATLDQWLMTKDEEIRVVVTGSTFGGTGSGVIPVLATHLRSRAEELGAPLKLGAVIQVRWFDLGAPPEGTTQDADARADVTTYDLDRNSSCLVEFYRENLASLYDRAYLVGHHPHAVRPSAGVERQPEHHHAVNLLSGYLAYRMLQVDQLTRSPTLLGVATPERESSIGGRTTTVADLENHLHLPSARHSLAYHIRATGAQVALARAVLNLLATPGPGWDVADPYPLFVTELVRRCRGRFGSNIGRAGADRVEPYTSWARLLAKQEEALQWLDRVRDASKTINACQVPERLLPPPSRIGDIREHERQLPGRLCRVFHRVLGGIPLESLGNEPERVVSRAFSTLRRAVEAEIDQAQEV